MPHPKGIMQTITTQTIPFDSLSILFIDGQPWLTLAQLSALFGRSGAVIESMAQTAFISQGVDRRAATRADVRSGWDGAQMSFTMLYSIDVVVALNERTNSQAGAAFRVWADRRFVEWVRDGTVRG
jgi:hypothetical protein